VDGLSSWLLAHNHAQAAAPGFRQADPQHFELRREITQQRIGGGMKPQCRRDQIEQWWRRLKLDSREISVTCEFALFQVAADAQPIVRGLQRKMNMLAGFQLEDGQPLGTCHGEKVEDAVFAASVGKDLGVDEARIESNVYSRDILTNQ